MAGRFLFSIVVALAFQLCGSAAGAASEPCIASEPCRMDDGSEYRVVPPPGWDGRTAIGAFVFIHGHRASAEEMIRYKDLVTTVHAQGYMLVAPQGLGDSWSTSGSPGDGRRDEVRYMSAMLDDLARRFPLDDRRLVASGFSQGASVVWEIACRGDGRFRAFVPIAGVWWRPMPIDCPAPRRPLLHIHGTVDPVMPMEGRALRDRWRQGDVREAFATMRRLNACDGRPVTEQRGPLACSFDQACGSGRPIGLCLHAGDHHTDPAWLAVLRDWLERSLLTGG